MRGKKTSFDANNFEHYDLNVAERFGKGKLKIKNSSKC